MGFLEDRCKKMLEGEKVEDAQRQGGMSGNLAGTKVWGKLSQFVPATHETQRRL